MKKIALRNLALTAVIFSLFYTSCKKTTNPTHPTPANSRLLSYTKFTTTSIPGSGTVNETYTFSYDAQKRVSQIVYSNNNSYLSGRVMTFSYADPIIYKTITNVRLDTIYAIDTFTQNLSTGQITDDRSPTVFNNFTPGADMQSGIENKYTYFGKLLISNTRSCYDSGTSISATSTYTSDNGDLLNHTYDGVLSAAFPDSGLNFNPVAHHDILSVPLVVTWSDYGLVAIGTTTHTSGTKTDQLTNYTTGDPISVSAVDPYGVVAYDTCFFTGNLWSREAYYVYPDLDNRVGDYLQIESFTTYGVNIYQNAHMIRQIVATSGPTTNVIYTIDADSKVTQTQVVVTDKYGAVTTTIYKLQYQTF